MAITEGLNIQKPRIPPLFRCPISLELMKDPVTLSTGLTYDRCSIEKWFEEGHNTCPATMQVLTTRDLVPNHTLRRLIQEWCVANKNKGIERIPTPKQPLELDHAKQILRQVSNSSLESKKRIHLLRTLRNFAKDSEKNRQCMAEAGAVHVLLGLVSSFDTSCSDPECCDLSVVIVSMLTRIRQNGLSSFKVTVSLTRVLSWILNNRSIEYQISAARVLQVLAEVDEGSIGETKGVLSGLVKLLKDGYPRATKASLGALQAVVSGSKSVSKAVVSEGAIPPLVELLAETNRQNTELSLAVLVCLVKCAEGRAALAEHALSIPILVKIILTVSDVASERAVNILWIMCKSDKSVIKSVGDEGGFTQMLLLIQADNTIHTVQRARELIKMLRTAVSQECLQNFAFTMPF